MLRAWIARSLRGLWSKPILRSIAASTHPWPQLPLLDLPEELVVLIISFLPRPDKLSAALACKPLHFICNDVVDTGPVPREDKEDFLLRLERDLVATHQYCAICMELHKSSSLNKPNENPYVVLQRQHNLPTCVLQSPQYSLIFSRNHFAYHHGRAVMNRHFYGTPAGLDPNLLCYKTLYHYPIGHRRLLELSSRYSVRIQYNSLYLFGKHIMDSIDIPSMTTKLDKGNFNICQHIVTTARPDLLEYTRRAAGLDASEISRFLQEPGRVVHGSCARCLTDYTVEISRNSTRNCLGLLKVFYRVEIQAYHDFGQFRSLNDWKWRAWGDEFERRDMNVYPPGSVYQQYYAAEEGGDKQLEISA